MSRILILSLGALMFGCQSMPNYKTSYNENVVSVVSDAGGGGSGVVLKSSDTASIILTNAHVCDAVGDMGKVKHWKGNSRIIGMKYSKTHDLCQVLVAKNYGQNTELAVAPPVPGDNAEISGHPMLLPMLTGHGHFSEIEEIQVVTDVQECSEEDFKTDFFCAIFGVKLTISTFDSQIVSVMIAGGSSGSPVFNSKGQLAGVVFAGIGDSFSPAFIVPFSYVRFFVETEAPRMKWQKPSKLKRNHSDKQKTLLRKVLVNGKLK